MTTPYVNEVSPTRIQVGDVELVHVDTVSYRQHFGAGGDTPVTTYVLYLSRIRRGVTSMMPDAGFSLRFVVHGGRIRVESRTSRGWSEMFSAPAPHSEEYARDRNAWDEHENAAYLDCEMQYLKAAAILYSS